MDTDGPGATVPPVEGRIGTEQWRRLATEVREKMRTRHMAYRTEQAYLQWIRRYIAFHDQRDPRVLGGPEVEQFLTHLAVDRKVSASTQNQALQAVLFLYRQAFQYELPWLENVTRAARPQRLPVVLSRAEVRAVLGLLDGTQSLIANLLYGSGLRVMEALRLRVKDVLFDRSMLIVRDAKGGKDRVTVLPDTLRGRLSDHMRRLRAWYVDERRRAAPGVSLPYALGHKYQDASIQWGWQYVFPARNLCRDPYGTGWIRHHVHEQVVTRAVKTTMIYTHVMQKGARGVKSPLDRA